MLLKKGSRGTNVKYLQYGLRIMCINPGSLDGIFGEGTYNAVRKIQRDHGLTDDGMVGNNTWKLLRATAHSNSVSSVNVEIANFIGLFKYIPIHCYNFDRESAPIQITPQVRLTGKISLAHTLGNADITMDLSNRKFSSASIYSGNISADFNKNVISKNNIKIALDNIGVKLADLQGGVLRAKLLGPCYSPNNFIILLEYSTSIGNITVYQTLKIHYTNFRNNAPQYSTNLSAKTAGVVIIGAVVAAACIYVIPAAAAEIVTAIATLARCYNYA